MRRSLRRSVAAVAVAGLAALLARQVPAGAAPSQADDPTAPILAIVSPLAAPVCAAAGSATLLVPIVGGLVGSTLGLGSSVDVADLVLDTIGPLYVVCGTLPQSAGTRCELDANIAGVWPAELSGFGLAPPIVVGGVVDALNKVLGLAGQPPVAQVAQTLQCVVPEGAGAVGAPGAPPAPGELLPLGTGLGGLSVPSGGLAPDLGSSLLPLTSTTQARPALDVPVVGTLVSTLDERVPGGVRALQAVVALALLLCLVRSWYTSWRVARLDAKGRT